VLAGQTGSRSGMVSPGLPYAQDDRLMSLTESGTASTDDTYGWAPFSTAPLDADEEIISVPFPLVLTPQLGDAALAGLEESSRLAAYVVLHWMAAAGARSDELDWTWVLFQCRRGPPAHVAPC
jgi:hypothetical protein